MRMSNLCDVYRETAAAPGGTALDHAKLRDTLVCMADVRVVLLKLADRLQLLRELAAAKGEAAERRRETAAQEALQVFSPLANRYSKETLPGSGCVRICWEHLRACLLPPSRHIALNSKGRPYSKSGV